MNATQIIKENRKPNTRYATNAKENVIAQWLNDRWTIIHVYTLDGKWINGGDGLLVNGKPIVSQDEFIEVAVNESPNTNFPAKPITCPECGQINEFANDDGAVEGPREYHAKCWLSRKPKITEITSAIANVAFLRS